MLNNFKIGFSHIYGIDIKNAEAFRLVYNASNRIVKDTNVSYWLLSECYVYDTVLCIGVHA